MKFIELCEDLTRYRANNLDAQLVGGRTYHMDKSVRGEYMLGLSFGNALSRASQRLAINAQDAREIYGSSMPLIAQHAILANMPKILESDYCIDSQREGETRGEAKLNTREALEVAKEHIVGKYGSNSIKNTIYIAHPAHMRRVEALAKKLGFGGTPFVDEKIVWNSIRPDPGWHSRSTICAPVWMFRELATRVHHKYEGWV